MKKIYNLKEEIIPLSRKQYIGLFLYIVCVFQFALFFSPALAKQVDENEEKTFKLNLNAENIEENIKEKESLSKFDLPVHESLTELYNNKEYKVVSSGVYPMTAYNSEPGQTDSTPCITANGFNVCEHNIEDTIAANFLKFGTKVRIPELFGDRIFVVRDRMNRRYTHRVDIWMINKDDAIQFGIKRAKIEVLKEI
jgi:3D (Asp-Asp-Asp) domain-containing protein